MGKVRYRAHSSFAVIVALLVVACGDSRANEYLYIYHETTITAGLISPAKVTVDANGIVFVSQPGLNQVSVYDAYWLHIKDINNIAQLDPESSGGCRWLSQPGG